MVRCAQTAPTSRAKACGRTKTYDTAALARTQKCGRARACATRIVLCLLALVLEGCLSISTPDYVLTRHEQLQKSLDVKIDISHASSFTGNVNSVLSDIDEQLSGLPRGYRAKIGTVMVRDGFFPEYLLLAPLVGGYTTSDGTVCIRNANITRAIQSVLLFPGNGSLIHEVTHSVQYHEMKRWEETGQPSPEFARFIKSWEFQYFGDADNDGEIDDRDVAWILEHSADYDQNKDGKVDFQDVELRVARPYVQGRWASLHGLQIFFRMSFEMFTPRPPGFACAYAKTYVWEDAAETMRYAWEAGMIPGLYSSAADAAGAALAWEKLARLRKEDPLFARKVFLAMQYIAAHEEQGRLSPAWLNYAAAHGAAGAAARTQ